MLPFLLLFLWFRFEQFLHVHLPILFFGILLFFGMLVLLLRILAGRVRILLLMLWLCIAGLVAVDFFQLLTYRDFSNSHFLKKIEECTAEVKQRTEDLLEASRKDSRELESELRRAGPFTPENIFIRLQERLAGRDFWWSVYNQDGRLISWHGQVPYRETYLQAGAEEVSVFNQLHQQFFKYRRSTKVGDNPLFLTVLSPISADYGIENRYLSSYNLLTDRLAIRPDLLYNSQQSTTTSPDLIIRTFPVTPDFSISTLYKKQQYGEFLMSRVFQLHWWLELVALIFFLFAWMDRFFEFVGVSGQETSGRALTFSWCVLLMISVLSAVTIAHFSAFGSTALFRPHELTLTGWRSLFRSPGSFFFTSFFVLSVTFCLVLLLKKINPRIPWKNAPLNYGFVFAAFFLSGLLFAAYYNFVRNALIFSPFDPRELSLLKIDLAKIPQIFGMVWLDLGFVMLIASLYAFVMANLQRDGRRFTVVLLTQLLVLALFAALLHTTWLHPVIPSVVLYCSLGVVLFFLPSIWSWLERINLLSRFLVSLLALSVISFLFHFTRFYYAGDLQRSFIEREAASQVSGQQNSVRDILRVSEEQLDNAAESISLDPKIPDLAYRLWARTQFAALGYKSAVEIYDESGKIVNRFSLSLPRLSVDVSRIASGPEWQAQQKVATFGNFRKPVLIAARILPSGGGYLVLETEPDYENLPFVNPSSPFQELFRPEMDARLYVGTLFLNVYDMSWHPVFISSPDISPPTEKGRGLLRNSFSAWAQQTWNGQNFQVFYFRINGGYAVLLVPDVSLRSHIVHMIDLLLFNLMWLSAFTLILVLFFRPYLTLHFRSQTATRFNFFQKLLFAFLVFSMIPMLLLSLLIRNYVWEKKIDEVTSRTLNSFSVATKVVGDYLSYRVAEPNSSLHGQIFSNELLEWISQVIEQDVSFYYDRYLLAASSRELFTAGLLGEQIPGTTYVDLFLKGQKYSITDVQIGSLRFLNVSGRIFSGRFKDEVITIPFLIDEKAVEAEITGLREYMILVGAGLILFAVFLGYFLANRFSRPVQVLIQGTGEMSRGNLEYRIRERYQDEFQQLVESFNAMAGSLDEQQETLERRRAYIENILNHITTAVISLDGTTNVTTVNPAAAQMFRIDPAYHGVLQDLLGSATEWGTVPETIRQFLASRESFQMKEVSLFRTNHEMHLRLVYVPLFEEERWNGAVLLVEDISDIIRSNRLSAWADMARRVAHEVKNPLTPIQLAVEHLVKVYQDRSENFDEVLRNCSDAVLKQVKALRKLVSDFSQYGRPAVLNRAEVDLKVFLDDLVANYREHLPEGIAMESQLEESLPLVRMDAQKIRGALMNIIENGLQAMNGRGTIRIEAGNQDRSFVRIRVSDSGHGVPPEILPRLFEPYFSTKTGGTGLGLAIARKNIEDHGGKIQVESQPQQGTSVTVLLPTS